MGDTALACGNSATAQAWLGLGSSDAAERASERCARAAAGGTLTLDAPPRCGREAAGSGRAEHGRNGGNLAPKEAAAAERTEGRRT